MKKETKQIKKIYNKIFDKIKLIYNIEKPILKIVHYKSGTFGSYNFRTNKLMINSTHDKFEKTIMHELCHTINEKLFNPTGKRKMGHNVKFWELCYLFGLTEKDYGYGLTNNMRKAKEKRGVKQMNKTKKNYCLKWKQIIHTTEEITWQHKKYHNILVQVLDMGKNFEIYEYDTNINKEIMHKKIGENIVKKDAIELAINYMKNYAK